MSVFKRSYQDLPRLTMNGKVLPLGNWQSLDVQERSEGSNLQA